MLSFLQKMFGFKETRAKRPRVTLAIEFLENRWVPATITVGTGGMFPTIQMGVNHANPGDTVLVLPGIYTEQVKITTNNITLEGSGQATTFIKAPASPLAAPNAIVDVNGALNVTIEAFTIEGPGTTAGDLKWGVRVDSGGSALITNNHITNIRDTPISGDQTGIGIDIGRGVAPDLTTGSAIITNNLIDGYQKGGILVDNTGSSATIANNVITGVGPTAVIAQNGIQISRGATATVRSNTISGNQFSLPSNSSTGILLFDPGAVSVTSNVISSNNVGISDIGSSGGAIDSNQVTHNTSIGIVLRSPTNGAEVGNNITNFNGSGNPGDAGIALTGATNSFIHNNQSEHNNGDGIFIDNTSSGNDLFQNVLKHNSIFDAQDQSTGGGTSGTANTWTQNLGITSSPAGLVNSAGVFGARSRWGSASVDALLMELRILSLKTPKPPGIP